MEELSHRLKKAMLRTAEERLTKDEDPEALSKSLSDLKGKDVGEKEIRDLIPEYEVASVEVEKQNLPKLGKAREAILITLENLKQ